MIYFKVSIGMDLRDQKKILQTKPVSPSTRKTVSKLTFREKNTMIFDLFVNENFSIQTGPNFLPKSLGNVYDFP